MGLRVQRKDWFGTGNGAAVRVSGADAGARAREGYALPAALLAVLAEAIALTPA